jgi:hypothetical protein
MHVKSCVNVYKEEEPKYQIGTAPRVRRVSSEYFCLFQRSKGSSAVEHISYSKDTVEISPGGKVTGA